MSVHLHFLLILIGLTGIHSITTVSKVSVKTGSSVIIPCLYDKQYINHVKGLCKGYHWSSCLYVVKTNRQNSGKFSISDDKSRRIFTVTIKDVTYKDTDYWCAVEIDGGPDVKKYFQLSVTRGAPTLYVDRQEITGFKGGNIIINCYYHNSGEFKWCRLGSSCVTMTSGSFYGTTVTIIRRLANVFTVTMSGLSAQSSGWYLCVKGDLQMPVHVTVDKQPTTNAPPTTTQRNKSGSVDLKRFIIPLGLLILVVMVTLFILFMLKRHKQSKDESSATATAKEEVTYSVKKKRKTPAQAQEEVTYSDVKHKRKTPAQAQEEVTYSNVKHKRKTPAQAQEEVTYSDVKHKRKTPDERSDAKSDVDVTYSSVVIVEQQTKG